MQDASSFMENEAGQYDLIISDIFDSGVTPEWMLQSDFLATLHQHLTPEGAIALNLIIPSSEEFKRYYSLFLEQFDQKSLCLDHEDYENLMIYGFKNITDPKSQMDWVTTAEQLMTEYDLPVMEIIRRLYEINPVGDVLN